METILSSVTPRGGARWRNVGLAAAFLVPFALYLFTLAPALYFEDSMEFALGCVVLGVDHPSGYPLETLAGHLFTYFPFGELAWRANVASAFFGALASAFIFLLTWELLAPAVADRRLLAAGSWAAGGFFAFSSTFWPQAVITEVYALNAAALAATLWCGARAHARRDARWFYATAFAASLAAANHPLSLVATGPLLIYLWFKLRREAGGRLLANAAALLLLGVSIYLYLALRASREPPLNWGVPADLPRFVDHVRRREFGTIFWPRYRYLGQHALELGRLLLGQFGPGAGALAAVGLVWLLKLRTPFAGMLAVLAAIVGPATMLPLVGLLTPIQVFEIEVWYLSFFLICAPFAAAAATLALRALGRRVPAAAAAVVLALLPAYPFLTNFSKADLRGFRFPEEHGRNRGRGFAYCATVAYPFYGRQGMFVDSYLHFVEGRRPDVIQVEPRNTIRSELEAVRRAPRFIVDPDAAEAWWFEFKRDLFASPGERPFYFNVNEADARAWGAELVPDGLVYRARRRGSKEVFRGAPWKRYEYRGLRAVGADLGKKELPYCPTTYRVWATYYTMAAEYCFMLGRDEEALRNLAEAARGGPKDAGVALVTAATYYANGYPGKAIPLYLECLPRMERSRHDSLMFRRDYSSTLNELAVAYLNAGDAETARRYFEESLAVTPEQRGLRRYLYGEERPPGGSGSGGGEDSGR